MLVLARAQPWQEQLISKLPPFQRNKKDAAEILRLFMLVGVPNACHRADAVQSCQQYLSAVAAQEEATRVELRHVKAVLVKERESAAAFYDAMADAYRQYESQMQTEIVARLQEIFRSAALLVRRTSPAAQCI